MDSKFYQQYLEDEETKKAVRAKRKKRNKEFDLCDIGLIYLYIGLSYLY